MGEKLTADQLRQPHGCQYTLWLAKKWKRKAAKVETNYKRWVAHFVIADIRYSPGSNAWLRSVDEVQRIYPGTKSWLLSCSASEGGHGRWVGYGGVPYSAAYEQTDAVGGNLQFRPSTYKGFIRHAITDARSRGFKIPESAWSWVSPLGQALAGAWGITHGMRSHWAGSGCR